MFVFVCVCGGGGGEMGGGGGSAYVQPSLLTLVHIITNTLAWQVYKYWLSIYQHHL